MTTRYFVDGQGAYLGGFEGAEPPPGAVEVQAPPESGSDVWVDGVWHPTPARMIADYTRAIQAHLDAKAKALGYDNIYTACTYADEPSVPKFQSEGQALRGWRSMVWYEAAGILADVQAGNCAAPSIEELIGGLPSAPTFE